MGLDVYHASIDWIAPPANENRIRFLMLDWAQQATFPTLPSTRPNPSSQLPHAPMRNILGGGRKPLGITRGCYVLSSQAAGGLGYEMTPNYNLRCDEGGVVNLDIREGAADTHWQDPRQLQDYITKQLRASALTNAADYEAIFSGDFNSDSPTYKWTIKNTTPANFTMTSKATDSNSILPSLGFTETSYSSAASYTAEERAIHTEEYFVVELVPPITHLHGTALSLAYRWLVFVDPNFNLSQYSQAHYPLNAAGEPKVLVYTGANAGAVDDEPDGTYVSRKDWFKLWRHNMMVNTDPICEGTDGALYPMASAHYDLPCRYWVVDLGNAYHALGENGDGIGIPATQTHLRVKIVDRQNPSGHISIGRMVVATGWYPGANNISLPYGEEAKDRSVPFESDGGQITARSRKPGREFNMGWTDTFLTAEDVWLLDSLARRPLEYDTTTMHPLQYSVGRGARMDAPMIYIDPLAGANLDGVDDHTWMARGTSLVRASFGSTEEVAKNLYRLGQVSLVEESG